MEPHRSAGGDRLYSDADVARLRLIKRLIGLGHAIGDVARLPDAELENLLGLHSGEPAPSAPGLGVVDRYLSHVERMDLAAADAPASPSTDFSL